jgi:hypothetical protein
MLKFCGERLLPLSSFESKGSNTTPQITISINGLTSPTVEAAEVIDNVEVTDVDFADEDDNG